jgi:N-acetylglutamate synthase-like GNAT family acetyltransferase
MIIRKAANEDCDTLSRIAYKSKAFWGYSKEFMDKCKDDLTITVSYMENNPVYVMEDDSKIVAFYTFSLEHRKLEALFIDPDYIGKGLGKTLWSDLLNKAKQLNLEEFTIDSDPNAEAFYLKMGAKKVGEIPSTVFPGRSLPLLSVKVK